jgi:hypothetical protein
VLQAAIQQLSQRGAAQAGGDQAAAVGERTQVPRFLPAERFQGARQGYYFGTSDEGTG